MLLGSVLFVALVLAVVIVLQMRSALGTQQGTQLGVMAVLLVCGAWGALEMTHRQEPPPPEDQTASKPVSSQTCIRCHESHFNSWQQTYHRTMTREATKENVKADFNDVLHEYDGVTSRMIERDGKYFLETVDPDWLKEIIKERMYRGIVGGIGFRSGHSQVQEKTGSESHATARYPKTSVEKGGAPGRREFSVDRIVGSHWFQQFMHRDEQGRYVRLPLAYHIVEKQWVHVNGVFLAPNQYFFGKSLIWNETCLYCHNTRPIKNPQPIPGQMSAYDTQVGELGISCEACHGAAERHVASHQNPARRIAQHYSDQPDLTIVNPARLSVERSVEICARCHAGTMPNHKEWNKRTYADPYLAGRDLKRFWHVAFSEAELKRRNENLPLAKERELPKPRDGRFWGDGTPLTTAVEYQGMALSACYQDGHGKMTCLTCHSMHDAHPNHQVKPGMRTNEACLQCHEDFRGKIAEHSHHAAQSEGSNCLNCHMPHQVYSLLDTHRSHRISIPRVKDSIGTGKPHACNLCHLDKSLGWTQDHLVKWYGMKPEKLSEDDQKYASSLLHLAQGDGRTRALVAGVFAWKPAQEASGRDWPALLLTNVLEEERYEAVRYSAHKALRSLYGAAARDYNYQGSATQRAAQLKALRQALPAAPDAKRYPYLPLSAGNAQGQPALSFDAVVHRLRETRNDPDVHINE